MSPLLTVFQALPRIARTRCACRIHAKPSLEYLATAVVPWVVGVWYAAWDPLDSNFQHSQSSKRQLVRYWARPASAADVSAGTLFDLERCFRHALDPFTTS